jgi:hypothetical protein
MEVRPLLLKYYLDREWSLDGDNYSGLTFLDGLPPITEEEFNEKNAIYQKEMEDTDYQRKRLFDYEKKGVTDHEMVVSLWERIMENRQQSSDSLQSKRIEIKQKYPKPS